jgi:hypothetical protein
MTMTHDETNPLFAVCTYKDHPFHADGTFKTPRVSQAIANLLASDYDLTNFQSYSHPTVTNGLDEPMIDDRHRAEFLFGLSELMTTMMRIGEIEHTNDWDWFVQIETRDGKWYGDYCKDGKLYDYEDPIWGPEGNGVIYCDSFTTNYDEETYHHMGCVSEAKEYYSNLTITLESWDGGEKVVIDQLRIGDLKRIIISQR